MPPELSIVIPCHGRADLLRLCLASVLCHSPRYTEILVVDDGSLDHAASRVAAACNVPAIRLPRRRGFCVAANVGLRAARGAVVELLNDDTEVTAGWAEAALAAFGDVDIGAVAPLVLRGPPQPNQPLRIDSAGDRYYRGGVAAKRGHGALLDAGALGPGLVFGASASSAFYRREAVLRVGLFPEAFGAYFEDIDLSFRLHRAGYAVWFEPMARVYHRQSSSYGRPQRRLLEQQSRNEERVFWRNLPTPELLGALPRHVAVLAGKALRRLEEGQFSPFLWGRLRLLREVMALVRHRRALQHLGPALSSGRWQVEARYWGESAA